MSQDNAPSGGHIDQPKPLEVVARVPVTAEPTERGSAEWREWVAAHSGIIHVLTHGEKIEDVRRDFKPRATAIARWTPSSYEVLIEAWISGVYEVNYIVEPDADEHPIVKFILLEAANAMPKSESNAVDHPAHYGGPNNPYEVIKVLEAWFGPEAVVAFDVQNAIKYLARAGKKDPSKHIEDLSKARWYIDHAIETLKNSQ